MKVILVIMMFHTITMRKMIYTGIYDFQLSHIESLNWYSCGTVAECVCLLQMQSSSLLIFERNLYRDNCCKQLCLDQEVGLPVSEVNNRRMCLCEVLYIIQFFCALAFFSI